MISKNIIINGDFNLMTRTIPTSNYFVPLNPIARSGFLMDRFFFYTSQIDKLIYSKKNIVKTEFNASAFPFTSCANISTNDGNGSALIKSLAAADSGGLHQIIEGNFAKKIYGQKMCLSFWVKAALPGIYPVSFRNGAYSRSYVSTYEIKNALTWEKKVISLEHEGDRGSKLNWNNANGNGMTVNWPLFTGSTYTTSTLNQWIDGNFVSHTSCVNGAGEYNQFSITGIQLEKGESPTSFELAGGNYQGELMLCQRYFERVRSTLLSTSRDLYHNTQFKVTKRVIPSLTILPINTSATNLLGATVFSLDRSGFRQNTMATIDFDAWVSADAEL